MEAPRDIERLLQERAWLKRVARALVHDEDRADDLTQATYVAALEHAPAHVERPRGWLGTVARNLWRNDARAQKRRDARERAHTLRGLLRTDVVPAPPALVERAELVERLGRLLLALREPYRTTLLLRYFEDLPAPEVARRMDVPLETVRTRVKRALAELAVGLDDEPGGRRAWVPALLAWAGGAQGAAVAGVAGALLMKKLLVGAAVLLLLVGGWGLTRGWFERRAAHDALPGDELTADGRPAADRAADAPELAGAPADARAAPETLRGPFALRGRVIDTEGRPAAGVPVRVRPALNRWMMPFPDAPPLDRDPSARAVLSESQSDADGEFTLPGLAHGVRYEVEAVPGPPRFGSSAIAQPWPWGELRVVLKVGDGVPLRGRVVDAAGKGVPAWVEASEGAGWTRAASVGGKWHAFFARTDGEGRFEFAAVPRGLALLSAIVPGFAARRAVPVRVPAPGEVLLTLAEPGGAELAGHVRDDAGKPVVGARLSVESHGRPAGPVAENVIVVTTTDTEGAYRAQGLLAGRVQDIEVQAPGYFVPAMLGYDTQLGTDRATLDIVLARGWVVAGQVVDAEDRPLAGVTVHAFPEFHQGDQSGFRREWTGTTSATGRFVIEALPHLPLVVAAKQAGYASARSARVIPTADGTLPDARLILTAQSAEAQAVRGFARRADGTAVAGTLVTALSVPEGNLWPQEGPPYYAVCRADGGFTFENLDPALAWHLGANATGFASQRAVLAPGGDRLALELVLERRPVLRGRVLTTAGLPVPDAKVRCRGTQGGQGGETGSALDGGFAFDTLAVGTYDLRVIDAMGQSGGADVRVELTAATDPPPVTLRVEALHVLGGTVVDTDGVPVVGTQVALGGFGGGTFTYTDVDGRFSFTLVAPGEFALALQAVTIPGSYATGRTDYRVVDARRRRPRVEVVLLGADGTTAQKGQVWFRTGPRFDGVARSSGSGAQAGGGKFWTDLEPDEKSFDLEVETLLDATGRRMNVRPQTFRDLDPAKSPFTLRLEAGRVLGGRVLDAAGKGVPGVRVVIATAAQFEMALRARGWGGVEVDTDAEGAFDVPGLPEGELVVGTGPLAGFVEPVPVRVRPDASDVALRLERGVGLAGHVVDPDGKPVGGAYVLARARGSHDQAARPAPSFVEQGWSAQTDASGAFALTGIPADARLDLTARPPAPWLEAILPDLAPGQGDVVLRVAVGVFVEGEVSGDGWLEGDPLTVVLGPPGSENPRFARGAVETQVPPGERRFRVGPVAAGSYDLGVCVGVLEPLVLEKGVTAPASGLRLTLPPARHVVGRIVGENVAGFQFSIRFGEISTGTSVDASGRFRVQNARPGRVTVVAFREGDERYGLVADVDPTAGPIEVRLQPGLVIEGRVQGLPEGEPATLRVIAHSPLLTKTVDDVHGDRFRLVGLPPGDYKVNVRCIAGKHHGYLSASAVAAGGPEVVLTFVESR